MIKLLGLPVLASEHGVEVDRLILYVHWLMGALFVGWIAYFLFVLFRFNRTRNPKASYSGVTSHASTWIEVGVIVAEAILLIGFAVPLWAKVVDFNPTTAKDAVIMKVTAEQFAWSVRYPGADGIFSKQDLHLVSATNLLGVDFTDPNGKDDISPAGMNEIYVPVNKPVIVHLTSKDVIHSFKVNPLRVTQDAIPGLSIPVGFKATQEGTNLLNCAQLCGNSHAFMKGYVYVVSQDRFDQWMNEQKAKSASGPVSFE